MSRIFHSNLSETDWTNDDYNKAKPIWKHFDIQNMFFFLKNDVSSLTDVFEI